MSVILIGDMASYPTDAVRSGVYIVVAVVIAVVAGGILLWRRRRRD